MTLPDEACRAVAQTRQFLLELLDREKTPRVPMAVRLQARRLLKHYPLDMEVQVAPNRRGYEKVVLKDC